MRVSNLSWNPFNIQKCLLPNCEFLRKNHGRYCIVTQDEHKFLVRIGLCEAKNVEETLFLDESVRVCFCMGKPKRTKFISFEDFVVVDKPHLAKTIKVEVVFVDFLDLKKYGYQNLSKIIRNVLKLFVIITGAVVNLNNLASNQKFGINCIIIKHVVDSRENETFRLDSSTQIIIEDCMTQIKFEQSQQRESGVRAAGCDKVYSILKETFDFSKSFNPQKVKFVNKLLLIGPSGCGKTTLVHNVASDCKCILLEVTASTINTLTVEDMEKKLKATFEEAHMYSEHKDSCVVLIEDIDLMSSGRTLHATRFTGLLVALLEELDNTQGVVVVATTNSPDKVNGILRKPKRFEDELEIMIPTEEERVEILREIISHSGVEVWNELLQEVSHWTPGFVGADLKLLFLEAVMIYNKINSLKLIEKDLLKECFKIALTKVVPSALRGTLGLCTTNVITFSQIGGLEDVKRVLDLSVRQQLETPEKFKKFGIPLTKGILLYGPPGCAKTTLVKALAKECNTTFLATSAADLYSPFVGDAEKMVMQLFTQARIGSPSILFIDEIDAVVGSKSGDRERGVQERLLSTLLIEMDGVGLKVNTQKDNSLTVLGDETDKTRKSNNSNVIVIGATNRPQLLDDALKRPGRFDRLLYVPPPDEPERLKILKKITEKMSLHESVDLPLLAKLTEFFSGADLKNLCQEAGLHALKCSSMAAEAVHQVHFDEVLSQYKPSLNEGVIRFYESFQKFNA